MLGWFRTDEVDEFASSIVAEIVRRIPPRAEMQEKKLMERLSKVHNAAVRRTVEFARARRLSLYQKARLGNKFKWALREAGYPASLADAWTYELVKFVTVNSRNRDGAKKSEGVKTH